MSCATPSAPISRPIPGCPPRASAAPTNSATCFGDAGITRIFTSELRRTIETAKPLADDKHLTPVVVPGADGQTLAARIAASGARDRVLVVGHSDTVPALLRALGVDTPIAIGEKDYDNLFIVVPQKDGRPVLLRLRY